MAQVVGTYLKLVANDTQHWHKLGAQMVGYSKDINTRKSGKPATIEFEHAMPATAAYLYLMETAMEVERNKSGKVIGEIDFNAAYDLVIDNYKLIVLDKAMDDKLRHATTKAGFSLQRRMPDGWSPIDGNWWQRYFNDIVSAVDGGINPESIIMLNGETMGQAFNINASGGIKFSKTATEINNAQTIDKAFSNLIKYSKTGESRGMSTFDFDDTLARTKSGVRYTMPNKEGAPAAGRKVIFLAGSAGSGKSNVIKQLGLKNKGFKIVNQDIALEWLVKNSGLPTDMRDFTPEQTSKWGSLQWEARDIAQRKAIKFRGRGNGVVVDGTGASTISLFTQAQKYKDAGYDVQMLFVESSLETALERNRARKERSLKDFIVERNWKAVQKNKKAFKEEFGDNFAEVNTDNLKQGDPMPKSLVNKINKFTDSYIKGRLTAEEFANKGDQLLQQGAKFDFSEFNQVVDGTPGPLLDKARERAKKYGTDNMFVLTARPQASAFAIQQFLKGQGLDIPIKNITGLANSTGEAKAMWMLEKFAEGYNDMYFVDDAYQNVKAVQDVLSQLDIKSKVVQAKIKFSKGASKQFNEMIERRKGVGAEKVFSSAEARKRGSQPDIIRFIKSLYIPPSAEDFKGLLYYFLGKGKQGNADMEFFTKNLLKPFAEGIRAWNTYKQNMVNDYDALKKQFPKIKLNNTRYI
jgi:predicted kinase